MALKLEVCSVIIPVDTLRRKLGDEVYRQCYADCTDVTWNDGRLYRDGCMNTMDLRDMLDDWEARGFELYETVDGRKHWKDLCVVNSGHGPSYPCRWLEYDPQRNIVWLQGEDPGEAVGPAGRRTFGES